MYVEIYLTPTTDGNLLNGTIQGYFIPWKAGMNNLKLQSIQYSGTAGNLTNQPIRLLCPNFPNQAYVSFLVNANTAENRCYANLTHLNIDLGDLSTSNYLYLRALTTAGALAPFDHIVLGFDIS